MSGLKINENLCIGCGSCVSACSQDGLTMDGDFPRVTENCSLCGICADVCPEEAIKIEREPSAAQGTDLSAWRDVWVFAQQENGSLLPVALELTAKGRELAGQKGCRLAVLLAEAEKSDDSAVRLITAGADEVIRCCDPRFAGNPADLLTEWICAQIRGRRPEIVLFGATSLGRELAPGIAVRLGTGLTADCTALSIDPETGLLQQTRPAFGGNLMATIVCPDHRPQMATVRAGVFSAPSPGSAAESPSADKITDTKLRDGSVSGIRILDTLKDINAGSIAKAEVIVDVGRGIGSRRNLPLMKRFAELIGGKLGCSRPLVEMGWCEYPHQIGQTGTAVAPKLLICVGVSGAIQHLAGIGGAETVVAVNSDPEAPIFGVSHYAVVGDCVEIIREAVEQLEQRRI